MPDPTSEQLTTLFRRVRSQQSAGFDAVRLIPDLADVHGRGRRARLRSRATAATAALSVAALLAGGVTVLWGSPASTDLYISPADTSASTSASTSAAPNTVSVPEGFLQPEDLGAGRPWTPLPRRTVAEPGGDGFGPWAAGGYLDMDNSVDLLNLQCDHQGQNGLRLTKPTTQVYRTKIDVGTGIWTTAELVTEPDEETTRMLRATAEDAGRRCTMRDQQAVVLARGDGLLVLGHRLPDGQLGAMGGYLLSGKTLVAVATDAGTLAEDPLPTPARWLVDLLLTAGERYNGTPAAMPQLTADAAWTPSSAPAPEPLPGYLTTRDLGANGLWENASSRHYRELPREAIDFLPCPASPSAASTSVIGQGGRQSYYGWTSEQSRESLQVGGWQVAETRLKLDPAYVSRAQEWMTLLASCPAVSEPDRPLLTRVETDPNQVAFAAGDANHLVRGVSWALTGTTLIELRTWTTDDTSTPVPASWLSDLTRTAAARPSSSP